MKAIWIILVLFVSTFPVYTQTGALLTGTVYLDSKPAADTSVELRPSKAPTKVISTKTDLDGRFRFENLPGDTYSIWAEKREPSSQPGLAGAALGGAASSVTLKSGQSKTIELTLNFDVYKSEAIFHESVTVAADKPQPIDEVSKTVNVIGAQELRERADFALVDTLRSLPGFRVQQLGGFGKTANIKTRGLRNQDTAVLVDGVRFRDATSITGDASPFLSDFTLTSVSKIEVLRGSGSSLYGTNAIGGVIDFQTPEPPQGWHGQVSGAAGGLGLGRFRGNISNAASNNKFGFNAGVSRTVYTKGIDGDDDANNTNFQSKINYGPTSNTNLSGRFFFSDAFVRLNSNPDTTGTISPSNFSIINAREGINFIPDVDDPDDSQRSRFFNGQFVVTQIVNKGLVVSGYYSGLSTRRRNETGPLGVGFQSASTSIFDGSIHTINGHINWTPNGANQFTAGYEFERENFASDGITPGGSGNFTIDAAQSSNTLYAQDLVSVLQGRLQLAGGVRAQFFTVSTPTFSLVNGPYSNLALGDPPTAITFDGAGSYFFFQTGTKLRVHVGNGYRVPSLYERFGTFFDNFSMPNRFVALGDPRLKPEKTIAFDGGIEQTFGKENVRLTAVYFYTKLIDTIGFGNVVPNIGSTTRPFGGYENQKGGIARGAEFSATIKPTRSTDVFTSYTFTNSDQRQPQVTGSRVIETLGIPKHQFTVVATQRVKKFWINVDMLFASSYLAPIFSNTFFNSYVYRFRGNRRADLTSGYDWKLDRVNLRLFGTIENVFNDRYFENGFRTTGRNARIGISFSF